MQHCWNIVGQQLPTLLDFTCCICLHTLLHVVGSCCVKFETSQTFNSTAIQHSYLFCDCQSLAQQCWIHLHIFSNIVGDTQMHYTWCPKSYWPYPSHDALQVPKLLGVVASICSMLGVAAEHTTLSNAFLAFCPENSKTSKLVLKLQFLTLRQDHKYPFRFHVGDPPQPHPPLC